MSERSRRLAAAWADAVRRHAVLVVVLIALATAGSVYYSAAHFAIDTDPDEMLSKDLPYRRKGRELAEVFPQYPNSIVSVVDGPNADLVDRAAEELTAAIAKRRDLFRSVFDPQGMRFFRQNGLLYLDTDELSDLVDRLAQAQPLLGTLWAEPNLGGLLEVLRRAVEQTRKGDAPVEVDFVFGEVAAVIEALARGQTAYLSWQELMRGRRLDADERRRYLQIQPVLDYGSLGPAGAALDGLRQIAADLRLGERFAARLRITGATALETEELRTVQQGTGLATIISSVLVGILLVWGLGSIRLGAAVVTSIFVGLAWTAAIAFLVVGRLNLVSVAFAVLFIGLSDEFGNHVALRFREGIDRGDDADEALREAAAGSGDSLALCALAAAIGFFSFLPTDYTGLAELGLIAGLSMFVALFMNLTLLPALLVLLHPRPRPPRAGAAAHRSSARTFVRRHARTIVVAAALLALAGAVLSTRARFDFDPMTLRDPESESVKTLLELADDRRATPYKIVELAGSLESAKAIAARVAKLEVVADTTTLADFVPKSQDEKLEMLQTASLFLLPSLSGERNGSAASAEERRRSVADFRAELERMISTAGEKTEAAAERRLAAAFEELERSPGLDDQVLAELEERLVATLARRLADLRLSLEAEPVTLADLPDSLRTRWLTPDGRARLEITPAKNLLHDDAALREFVGRVRESVPDAAGMPVDIMESGRAVVRAFVEATALAMALVVGLIVVLLRRVRDVLLIFAPLALAALVTTATTVLFDLPFNFANVIVLPLLFGLGVASGIHLVMREREEAGGADVLETSTPRAVVVSALTTIGSFGSLALVRHPGTASMGVLLTVAITVTLICTLLVLPALMQIFPLRKRGAAPTGGRDASALSPEAPRGTACR